jgi:hypothetical protein
VSRTGADDFEVKTYLDPKGNVCPQNARKLASGILCLTCGPESEVRTEEALAYRDLSLGGACP